MVINLLETKYHGNSVSNSRTPVSLVFQSGYGSKAVELLSSYFEGLIHPISEVDDVMNVTETPYARVTEAAEKASLLEENIKPRTNLPPLLVHLRERQPEKLHYIGVSFGLTQDLFRFWRKRGFAPFYIGQIPSAVTGEHTCMVLKPLNNDDIEDSGSDKWGFFGPFYEDFRQRFTRLLQLSFREMEYKLAMSILEPKINFEALEATPSTSDGLLSSIKQFISPHDMKRLEAYTNNLADFHLILDLVPTLAHLYFKGKLPVTMSYAQASVLLCIGLQGQNISYIEGQIKLERQQILSLFIKVMKKFHKYLYNIASKEFESTLPQQKEIVMKPHSISVDEDLKNAAKQVEDERKSETDGLLDPELLQQYAIVDREADFENALPSKGKIPSGGLVSLKSSKTKIEKHGNQKESHKSGKKRSKDDHRSNSNKKKRS
ncbi:RNA cytidine acetyltransferase 1-like [Corylus avellana]|uniref:RNA cytidine acetyltransferase 1-like n=1 Tax=Corylus avellana TaxID=13451 RepID=UPI00286C45BA|nr:RNA cytidine acetyltransferase 1-like [Corylus avellana]